MKNKIRLIITIIVLLLVGLISYKIAILYKYRSEKVSIDNKSIFNETLNITYNQCNDTITFEEMSYCNYFSDHVSKENVYFKVKYDENGKVISFYNIVKDKQYINVLSINSFELSTDEEKELDYSTGKDMKKFLDKNNIKDDIDLLKYIKDNYYLNSNLFTSSVSIKNNYIINEFALAALPEFESITLINGDKVKGYIVNTKSTTNIKEIHLLYNDNQYIILLSGDEITNINFIKSLLESISFGH